MTYNNCKKLIEVGKYESAELSNKLDIFLLANRITTEQYKELIMHINNKKEGSI